tara:strand:- start:94 stop:408 length:315 start_codon:yes stop_codon:yes gene_type:complete
VETTQIKKYSIRAWKVDKGNVSGGKEGHQISLLTKNGQEITFNLPKGLRFEEEPNQGSGVKLLKMGVTPEKSSSSPQKKEEFWELHCSDELTEKILEKIGYNAV